MTRKAKIPHSLLLKHRYAKTASALLERLPITQQFTASRKFLLQITPAWHQWCSKVSKKHKQRFDNCQLTAFEKGVLSISTNNAHSATLLKHQIDSLLRYLHQKGFAEIHRIRVHMQLPTKPANYRTSRPTNNDSDVGRHEADDTAIAALESAVISTNDPMLAESLQRLAQTLKKKGNKNK